MGPGTMLYNVNGEVYLSMLMQISDLQKLLFHNLSQHRELLQLIYLKITSKLVINLYSKHFVSDRA